MEHIGGGEGGGGAEEENTVSQYAQQPVASVKHAHNPSTCLLALQQVVQIWRKELSKINAKAAESLADPGQYSNLFPDLDLALKAEQQQRQQRKEKVPAQHFQDYEGSTMANLIEEIRGETCRWSKLRQATLLDHRIHVQHKHALQSLVALCQHLSLSTWN